jgi:hypothetical protein
MLLITFLVTLFMGTGAANFTLKTTGGFFSRILLGMNSYKYVPVIYETIGKNSMKHHRKWKKF